MEKYLQLGGEVISFGKPKKEYFDKAIYSSKFLPEVSKNMNPALQKALFDSLRRRAIHIGDSLHHDIAGKSNHRYLLRKLFNCGSSKF